MNLSHVQNTAYSRLHIPASILHCCIQDLRLKLLVHRAGRNPPPASRRDLILSKTSKPSQRLCVSACFDDSTPWELHCYHIKGHCADSLPKMPAKRYVSPSAEIRQIKLTLGHDTTVMNVKPALRNGPTLQDPRGRNSLRILSLCQS